MNLRIAKKIVKRIGTPDGDRYNEYQKLKALQRLAKTTTEKQNEQFFRAVVNTLTTHHKIKLLIENGEVGLAFKFLMKEPFLIKIKETDK